MKEFLFWSISFLIAGGVPLFWDMIICRNEKIYKFTSDNEWIYFIWYIISGIIVWFVLMPMFGFEFDHYNFNSI